MVWVQTSRQFLVFRVFFLRAALLYSSYMFVHFHSDDHSILTLFQSVSQGDRLLLTVRAGVLNVTLSPLFGWCKPDPALHLVKKASKGTHRIYSASCLPTHHLRLFVLSPHSDSLSLSPPLSLSRARADQLVSISSEIHCIISLVTLSGLGVAGRSARGSEGGEQVVVVVGSGEQGGFHPIHRRGIRSREGEPNINH